VGKQRQRKRDAKKGRKEEGRREEREKGREQAAVILFSFSSAEYCDSLTSRWNSFQ